MIITERLPAETAADYLRMGIVPIPVAAQGKAPTMTGWVQARSDTSGLLEQFQLNSNVGLLLGEGSGNLVDVDMDWPECTQLYPLIFPKTATFGRVVEGALQTRHILLRSDLATLTFDAPASMPGKRRIVELLSTGKQVVGPGSIYADGQQIQWIDAPTQYPVAELPSAVVAESVQRLAGAALLCRVWPELEGSRHEILLPLTGAMVRAGWPVADIAGILVNIMKLAGDTEYRDRQKAIVDTLKRADAGATFSGLPRLAEYMDPQVLDCLVRWWGLAEDNDPTYGLTGMDTISAGKADSTPPATGKASSAGTHSLDIVRASDVVVRPIDWLWKGRIALGKVTLFAGDPGTGKSMLTARLAAHIVNGTPWPVDLSPCDAGDVMIMSAEDDPEDTIVPRLMAAGANLDRIHILGAVTENCSGRERGFCLDTDIPLLDAALSKYPTTRIVFIDPISAHMGRNVDSHNDADVRSLLAPSAKLAEKHNVAVVLVAHLNKGGGKALYRVIGSIGFTGAARAAFMVTKDPENEAVRLIVTGKNNLAKDTGNGLSYTIMETAAEVPYVQWGDSFITSTADEIFDTDGRQGISPARAEAGDFILTLLMNGPVEVSVLKEQAKGAGISWRTIERAKEDVGARSIKRQGVEHGEWEWHIDPSLDKSAN